LETRNQELEAVNMALREKLTKKLEGVYNKLDDEIENHAKFV
jgi:hypothetical protein